MGENINGHYAQDTKTDIKQLAFKSFVNKAQSLHDYFGIPVAGKDESLNDFEIMPYLYRAYALI